MADATKISVSPRGVAKLRERYGVTAFDAIPNVGARLKTIKIAVLDNGFGDKATLADDLPPALFKLVDTYTDEFINTHKLGTAGSVTELDSDVHGRQMAMLAWAMTGLKKDDAPQFLLLNANGFTNFRRAVQTAINEKVDIILNSQNWEYGGNFDGRGFINAEVSKATATGILWVNAAGNHAGKVHNAAVVLDESKHVKLGHQDKGVRLKCRSDRSNVKITLAWNSNGETESVGTTKDLDLFLLDANGNVVAKSEKKQILNRPGKLADDESYVAREIIDTDLARTEKDKPYRIKVFAKNGNFTAADRLRITITTKKGPAFDADEKKMVEAIELVDFQPRQEIMIPADHPEVIAVADMTTVSSRGPTMDGRTKPDVMLRYSEAEFTDGEGFGGTSNAAAYFAGILAMTKAYVPNLTREMVMAQVKPQLLSATIRPGEAKGIKDLGVDVVRKTHGRLMTAVEETVGDRTNKNPIVLAGKYENGMHIIALNTSPLLLGKYQLDFPNPKQNPDHFEIYIAEVTKDNRQVMWVYTRDKAQIGATEEQEWEKVLKKNPELFMEVTLAKVRSKPENDPKVPLWEPPPLTAWAPKK